MNIGARRPPPRKIIMNVSVNDDVQLKKSENAWKPGLKREGPAEDPETLKTQAGTNIHKSSTNEDTQNKYTRTNHQHQISFHYWFVEIHLI